MLLLWLRGLGWQFYDWWVELFKWPLSSCLPSGEISVEGRFFATGFGLFNVTLMKVLSSYCCPPPPGLRKTHGGALAQVFNWPAAKMSLWTIQRSEFLSFLLFLLHLSLGLRIFFFNSQNDECEWGKKKTEYTIDFYYQGKKAGNFGASYKSVKKKKAGRCDELFYFIFFQQNLKNNRLARPRHVFPLF